MTRPLTRLVSSIVYARTGEWSNCAKGHLAKACEFTIAWVDFVFMARLRFLFLLVYLPFTATLAQTPASDTSFAIALPARRGQLRWPAACFKIVQSSAKPHGKEIGLREMALGVPDKRKVS